MIRVTGGRCRGRVLPAPVPPGVRPTGARVREALFNVLGNDLAGWSLLDLFGGSGLVAIEAASRGAAPVTVVERDPRTAAGIRANVAALGLEVAVRVGDAARVAVDAADIVFLDPPYREPITPWLQRGAERALRVLVAEVRDLPGHVVLPGFRADPPRRYGETSLLLFERVGPGAVLAEAEVVGDDSSVVEGEGGG